MRAELGIKHQGDFIPTLVETFGANNPAVLQGSVFAKKSPRSAASIRYSVEARGLLLLAWPTPGRLFLYVESSGGRLRETAANVWAILHTGGAAHRPELEFLVLFDEDANDGVAEARVGLSANFSRELTLTFITGLVSAIWIVLALAFFDVSGDTVLGAVPAFIAATIALVALLTGVRNKRLVWR